MRIIASSGVALMTSLAVAGVGGGGIGVGGTPPTGPFTGVSGSTSGPTWEIGSASAPIGRHAEEALARLGLKDLNVVSREPNVRLVRAKVELGAADAAIIYATDALKRPRLEQVTTFPNTTIEIQLAELQGAPPELYDFFSSAPSQATLQKYGFKTP